MKFKMCLKANSLVEICKETVFINLTNNNIMKGIFKKINLMDKENTVGDNYNVMVSLKRASFLRK